MDILIERDGGATRIRKQVETEADARGYEASGFVVYLVAGSGDDETLTRLGPPAQEASAESPVAEESVPAPAKSKKKAA